MVSSWLLKVVLGIVLAGGIVIELGSPLVAKAQADDAANQIADETAFRLNKSFTKQILEDTCKAEGERHRVDILTCKIVDGDPRLVEVRVRKEARSLVLKNWSATEDWYRPEVTATTELK
ncbi:MAG TPA: hypothetical protein VF230_05985 [Acidimicrobiales bacterium]